MSVASKVTLLESFHHSYVFIRSLCNIDCSEKYDEKYDFFFFCEKEDEKKVKSHNKEPLLIFYFIFIQGHSISLNPSDCFCIKISQHFSVKFLCLT